MKYKALLSTVILLSSFTLSASAQTDSISLSKDCNLDTLAVFTKVTHPPSPRGNFKVLVMNQEAIKEAMSSLNKSQDSAVVSFIVKKNGNICNLFFIGSTNDAIKSAVSKLLHQSMPWEAGTYDGGRMLNVFVSIKLLFNYDKPTNGLTAIINYVKPN